MKFIKGHDREQTYLFPVSLDQSIDPENEVRLIDLFAEIWFKLNQFKTINFSIKILTTFFERLLNRLIFAYYLIRTGAF